MEDTPSGPKARYLVSPHVLPMWDGVAAHATGKIVFFFGAQWPLPLSSRLLKSQREHAKGLLFSHAENGVPLALSHKAPKEDILKGDICVHCSLEGNSTEKAASRQGRQCLDSNARCKNSMLRCRGLRCMGFIDDCQITHLICVRLKRLLYHPIGGCFGTPSCYFSHIKGSKAPPEKVI